MKSFDLDKDNLCYGCEHYIGGEEKQCNPPTICVEGNLNFTTIKELFTKEMLSEREIKVILEYYLSFRSSIDWFGCTGVSNGFSYEYIENYRKDNELVHKFKSNYHYSDSHEYLQCEVCGNKYTLKDCEEDIKIADFPFCPKCGGCPVGTKHIKSIPKVK